MAQFLPVSGEQWKVNGKPDRDGTINQDGRQCVGFGCLEVADWMVHDLQGGELPPARLTWT